MTENCRCLSCGKTFEWNWSEWETARLLCMSCWEKMDRWYTRLGSRPRVATNKSGRKYLNYQPDHVRAWIVYDKAMKEKTDVRSESGS